MTHVVDTHGLLWFFAGDPRLGANARTVLSDPASQLVLPATVLAEAIWIIERGRVAVSYTALLAAIDADGRFRFCPLDRAIVEESASLTTIGEMHDRQIVATARLIQYSGESVAILTKDSEITAAGLIPVVW